MPDEEPPGEVDSDELILEDYKTKSVEFRKLVPFLEYWKAEREYNLEIEKAQAQNSVQEDLFKDLANPPPKNDAPARKCAKCAANDVYGAQKYCGDCTIQLQDEAKSEEERIRAELGTDKAFLTVSSETQARAYAKRKYQESRKRNEFIPVDQIAREEYALREIKKKQAHQQVL